MSLVTNFPLQSRINVEWINSRILVLCTSIICFSLSILHHHNFLQSYIALVFLAFLQLSILIFEWFNYYLIRDLASSFYLKRDKSILSRIFCLILLESVTLFFNFIDITLQTECINKSCNLLCFWTLTSLLILFIYQLLLKHSKYNISSNTYAKLQKEQFFNLYYLLPIEPVVIIMEKTKCLKWTK